MSFKTLAGVILIFCFSATEFASAQTASPDDQIFVPTKRPVAPIVAWQKRNIPIQIKRFLPAKANIIKGGIASIGPRGARRWVLVWTNSKLEQSKSDIHISVFSRQGKSYLKSSERNVGIRPIRKILLYWLNPKILSGPMIYFGDGIVNADDESFGRVDLVVFPNNWQGEMFSQKFEFSHFYPHDISYALPFLDDKGVVCVVRFHEFQDGEKIFEDETLMRWNGKEWAE